MYARIARFEGGDTAALEKETEEIGRDIEAAKRGEPGSQHSAELMKTVSRLLALADRRERQERRDRLLRHGGGPAQS